MYLLDVETSTVKEAIFEVGTTLKQTSPCDLQLHSFPSHGCKVQ